MTLEGVREYGRIRRYLECIYLYGFFSREDFAQAGVGSVKDYDYGTKLIRSIFPETEDEAVWQNGRKYLRFQREYAKSGDVRIADSYLLAVMDVEDELPALMGILSAISEKPQNIDDICLYTAIHTQVENALNYHTVRRWLLDLVDYGYAEKNGRLYRIKTNFLQALSGDELMDLYEYVSFIAGVTYPRVAGSFLKRTLEREFSRRAKSVPEHSRFLLRHSVKRSVFDEELVYQIMENIVQKHPIELRLENEKVVVQPVALRADTRLGRWYLLCMTEKGPWMLRISAIKSVKSAGSRDRVDEAAWEQGSLACKAAFAYAGCSGALPQAAAQIVRAKLNFENAPGMRNQFERELRFGEVVEREDGVYYQAKINDPIELTAYLRSFSPWLKILPGEYPLDERVRSDLENMRAYLKNDTVYEGEPDESVS